MRKIVIITLILSMMLLLAACGGSKIKAKPLSAREPSTPTAAATVDTSEPEPTAPVYEDSDSGMTAAEAIKDLQQTIQTTSTDNTGNFYPQAPEGVEGRDALKARTKALMSQTADIDLGIEADRRTGSISDDLPDEYDNDQSAGE